MQQQIDAASGGQHEVGYRAGGLDGELEARVGALAGDLPAAVPSSSTVMSPLSGSSISRSMRLPVLAVAFQSTWLSGSPG